jgi:hypothetical protein
MSRLQRAGDALFASQPKINSELLTLTYGALVTQLIADYKDIDVVNVELEKMGYNIGVRLIDEFLAKANITHCKNFKDTANTIAKVAFKLFLGVTADVGQWRADGKQCTLIITDNPLDEFVELPAEYAALQYSNLLCGVIRGALHLVQMVVSCELIADRLHGAGETQLRLTLKEMLIEQYNDEEDG